jgi:hypothetical protein
VGSWEKGAVRERDHLRALLSTLPAGALLVADCGYQGYALACDLAAADQAFLIRVSALSTFFSDEAVPSDWQDGLVWYWPQEPQRLQQRPLQVRLLRVRSEQGKNDVWLVSNVLQAERLSLLLWTERWRKAPAKKQRGPTKQPGKRECTSAYRLLQADREKKHQLVPM